VKARRSYEMIKYGIVQAQIDELVKLGWTETKAREAVAQGKAENMIKEAKACKEPPVKEENSPSY